MVDADTLLRLFVLLDVGVRGDDVGNDLRIYSLYVSLRVETADR